MPAAADDADFGGDLLETVQETQNDEEEQALTGSQVSFGSHQGCNVARGCGAAKSGLPCISWLADKPCSSPVSCHDAQVTK